MKNESNKRKLEENSQQFINMEAKLKKALHHIHINKKLFKIEDGIKESMTIMELASLVFPGIEGDFCVKRADSGWKVSDTCEEGPVIQIEDNDRFFITKTVIGGYESLLEQKIKEFNVPDVKIQIINNGGTQFLRFDNVQYIDKNVAKETSFCVRASGFPGVPFDGIMLIQNSELISRGKGVLQARVNLSDNGTVFVQKSFHPFTSSPVQALWNMNGNMIDLYYNLALCYLGDLQ